MGKIKFYKDDGLTKQVEEIISFLQVFDYGRTSSFEKILSNNFNIKFLGSGINAYAFRLNSKKIIRIEFSPSRDSYFKWMKYCLKNQEMKSLPKIHMACMIPSSRHADECLVTVCELLIPLKGSHIFKNIDKISSLIWGLFDENASTGLKPIEIFSQLHSVIKPGFQKIIFPQEYLKIKKSVRGINDLHSGNMMLSPNKKRLVLTDPIC